MFSLHTVPGADPRAAETIERFLNWLYRKDQFVICERDKAALKPLAPGNSYAQGDRVELLARQFLGEECR